MRESVSRWSGKMDRCSIEKIVLSSNNEVINEWNTIEWKIVRRKKVGVNTIKNE